MSNERVHTPCRQPSREPGVWAVPRDERCCQECQPWVLPRPQPPGVELRRELVQGGDCHLGRARWAPGPLSARSHAAQEGAQDPVWLNRRGSETEPLPTAQQRGQAGFCSWQVGPKAQVSLGLGGAHLPVAPDGRGAGPATGTRGETGGLLSPCAPRRGHGPHNHLSSGTVPGGAHASYPPRVLAVTSELWQSPGGHAESNHLSKVSPTWQLRLGGEKEGSGQNEAVNR